MSGVRVAVIGSCLSALSCAAVSAYASDAALTRHVTVAVCDLEAVPPDLMILAQHIAAQVYSEIGIELDWINNQCSDERVLTIRVTSRGMADPSASDYTLGFAESGTRSATVLYDRVRAIARRYHIKQAVLLGYVMAHELGHLLLPPKSHSASGLMRATLNLELASAQRLQFTPNQAALIFRKLDESAPRLAAATR